MNTLHNGAKDDDDDNNNNNNNNNTKEVWFCNNDNYSETNNT
jgi:hypothetical protein